MKDYAFTRSRDRLKIRIGSYYFAFGKVLEETNSTEKFLTWLDEGREQ